MSIAATAPSRAAAGAVAQCGTAAACDLWHARREHGGTQRHAHAHAHTDGWLATEALTCDAVRVRVEDRADRHAVLRVPHNDHRVLALCTLAPSASTHQPKVGNAEYGVSTPVFPVVCAHSMLMLCDDDRLRRNLSRTTCQSGHNRRKYAAGSMRWAGHCWSVRSSLSLSLSLSRSLSLLPPSLPLSLARPGCVCPQYSSALPQHMHANTHACARAHPLTDADTRLCPRLPPCIGAGKEQCVWPERRCWRAHCQL
jgi:hypothetical protein